MPYVIADGGSNSEQNVETKTNDHGDPEESSSAVATVATTCMQKSPACPPESSSAAPSTGGESLTNATNTSAVRKKPILVHSSNKASNSNIGGLEESKQAQKKKKKKKTVVLVDAKNKSDKEKGKVVVPHKKGTEKSKHEKPKKHMNRRKRSSYSYSKNMNLLLRDSIVVDIPLHVTADLGLAVRKARERKINAIYKAFPDLIPAENNTPDEDDDDDDDEAEEGDASGVVSSKTKKANNKNNKTKKAKPTNSSHVPKPSEYSSMLEYLEAKYVQGVMIDDSQLDGPSSSTNASAGPAGNNDEEEEGQGSVYSESSFLDDTDLQRNVAEQVLAHTTATKLELQDEDNDFFVNVGELEVEESEMTKDNYDPLNDIRNKKDTKIIKKKRKRPADTNNNNNSTITSANTKNNTSSKNDGTKERASKVAKKSASSTIASTTSSTNKATQKGPNTSTNKKTVSSSSSSSLSPLSPGKQLKQGLVKKSSDGKTKTIPGGLSRMKPKLAGGLAKKQKTDADKKEKIKNSSIKSNGSVTTTTSSNKGKDKAKSKGGPDANNKSQSTSSGQEEKDKVSPKPEVNTSSSSVATKSSKPTASKKGSSTSLTKEQKQFKEKATALKATTDAAYKALVDMINGLPQSQLPRRKTKAKVALQRSADKKPGDTVTFSNPHYPGQKLRVKIPENTEVGGTFKVTVPVKPVKDEDNETDHNKWDRSFYDRLEEFARSYDDWCDAEGDYRKLVGDPFAAHVEKRNKFDELVKEFPKDLMTTVDRQYLQKILRRARQNKHKREQTLLRQAARAKAVDDGDYSSISNSNGNDDDGSNNNNNDRLSIAAGPPGHLVKVKEEILSELSHKNKNGKSNNTSGGKTKNGNRAVITLPQLSFEFKTTPFQVQVFSSSSKKS